MGDESAINALAQRLDANSPDQVAGIVAERLRFREAAAVFQRDYADVWDDAMTRRLAIDRDAELARAEPTLEYAARLSRVGDELRRWLSEKRRGTSAARSKRETVVRGPTRRVAAAEVAEDDGPPEEDTAKVIGRMARSRGKVPYFHPHFENDPQPDYSDI